MKSFSIFRGTSEEPRASVQTDIEASTGNLLEWRLRSNDAAFQGVDDPLPLRFMEGFLAWGVLSAE